MDIVRLSITRPVGVAVGVILIVMFGIKILRFLPTTLATPAVDPGLVSASDS